MGDLRRFEETADDPGEPWGPSPKPPYSIPQVELGRKAKQKMVEFIDAANAAIAAGVKIEAELDEIEHATIGVGLTKRLTGTVRAFVSLEL